MTYSEMDLNGINILAIVVQEGGFSAAARRLSVPANRISRRVQRLEETLGVRLLQRTTRKLSLTTAGHTLLSNAEPALVQLDSLWNDVQSLSEEPQGHLRISAPINLLEVVSIDHFADFLNQYPSISLEFLLSDEQVDLFATGIDVALRGGPVQDENVIAQRLVSGKFYIVASPDYLELHGMPRNLEAMSTLPCVALRSKYGVATWELDSNDGKVSIDVRSRLTVNGMGALIKSARAGLGAALAPEYLVKNDIDSGNLIHVLPEYWQDGRGIFVVYSSRRHLPAALRVFLDYVHAKAGTAIEL